MLTPGEREFDQTCPRFDQSSRGSDQSVERLIKQRACLVQPTSVLTEVILSLITVEILRNGAVLIDFNFCAKRGT